MKLLFEEYAYPVECLQNLVSSHFYSLDKEGKKAKLNFVGYFFNNHPENPKEADAVFILPKVFLNKNHEPFEQEGVAPENIIDLDDDKNELLKTTELSSMISELSIWLYQAMQFYRDRNTGTTTLEKAAIRDVVSNKGEETVTYLDTVLQLRQFYKEHRQLLTFITIVNNSGNNKIQWAKTISHELPVIRNNRPAYVSFRTKKKVINFDEELIVLFYSVLDYLKHRFHFSVKVDVQYTLFSHRHIEGMIEGGKGTKFLKKIRKKYFTDEFVALWKLLYTYFDKAERIASRRYHDETLLVRNFNQVFEDMIDYLISDDVYPRELKVQNGGTKLVDHLYEERSLIYDEHIYFVGDSKYYDVANDMEEASISKQYYYAKNIIQRNIDVIFGFDHDPGKTKATDKNRYFHYRDELTKGYNITPNFFISGIAKRNPLTKKYDRSEAQLENITGEHVIYNRHFLNRLFDRDTLILQRYNINFLYVLTAYAAQQQSARNQFRRLARRDFREHIIDAVQQHYTVYQICLKENEDLKDFVKRNYYQLAGRIFSFEGILLYGEELMKDTKNIPEDAMSKVISKEGKTMLHLEDEDVELAKVEIGSPIIKQFAADEAAIRTLEAEPQKDEPHAWQILENIDVENQFRTHLPVYSVRAACGAFLHGDLEEQEGWLDVTEFGVRPQTGMFIVHAEGDSMMPKIHDQDLCVFTNKDVGGTRNGRIVLVESNKFDCRHVIKEYHSTKVQNEEEWAHDSITLHSLNPEYPDIILTEEDEPQVVGFFVTVLTKS